MKEFDIIKKPVFTEKGTQGVENKKYSVRGRCW